MLLDPVHEKEADEGEENDDGLEGNEIANEQEEIDNIDVLVANLELDSLHHCVQFFLRLAQL